MPPQCKPMADGEVLLVFHYDMNAVTMPERVGEVHALFEVGLWANTGDAGASGKNTIVEQSR